MNNRLKDIRISKKLTQVDLAEKTGISKQQISRFEQGQHISDKDIVKICKALKITSDYFLKLTNDDKKEG